MLLNCLLFVLFSYYRNENAPLSCNMNLIAARLIFELKNNSNDAIVIQFIGVFNHILQFGKLNPSEFPLTIQPGKLSTMETKLFFAIQLLFVLGDTVTIGSPTQSLSSCNHYVIVLEESVTPHIEIVQNYLVEVNIFFRTSYERYFFFFEILNCETWLLILISNFWAQSQSWIIFGK